MSRRVLIPLAAVLLSVFSSNFVSDSVADNWPRWRGPLNNGVAEQGVYPVSWSPTDNIAWKVPLPGRGTSTPIVWDNAIFVTSPSDGKNAVLCLDREGNTKWTRFLGKDRGGKNRVASGSNPSPTTDGKLVFTYFRSGDLACLDFEGNVLWHKNLQKLYGEDTLWWDLGTSPALTEDAVVIACMQEGPSYVAAFDKQTGELKWKQDRTFDVPRENDQAYTTPLVIRADGREVILVSGADHVTAHDAQTGKEIWRSGGLNPKRDALLRAVPTPVVDDSHIFVIYMRGGTLTQIQLGGQGDVTDTHVRWTVRIPKADAPSPVLAGDHLYICSDRGEIACLNAKSGEILWEKSVPRSRSKYYSSPILADGKIYMTRQDGTVYVLDTEGDQALLATNEMGEFTVSTPVFVDGQILLRTGEHLWCIGKSATSSQ